MNKLKWVLAIGGLAAMLTLSVACLGARTDSPTDAQPTTTTQPPSQTETRAAAQLDQAAGQQGGIWVSGEGKLTLEPDLVMLNVGVESLEDTVSEANAAASKSMADVMAALKARDIEDKDIQTSYFNIYPQYDYRADTPTLTGYNVRNTVSVKIRDLDNVGALIDEVVTAGGDSIRIDGISFTVGRPRRAHGRVARTRHSRRPGQGRSHGRARGRNLGRADVPGRGRGPVLSLALPRSRRVQDLRHGGRRSPKHQRRRTGVVADGASQLRHRVGAVREPPARAPCPFPLAIE